jgi:hypothetical protein
MKFTRLSPYVTIIPDHFASDGYHFRSSSVVFGRLGPGNDRRRDENLHPPSQYLDRLARTPRMGRRGRTVQGETPESCTLFPDATPVISRNTREMEGVREYSYSGKSCIMSGPFPGVRTLGSWLRTEASLKMSSKTSAAIYIPAPWIRMHLLYPFWLRWLHNLFPLSSGNSLRSVWSDLILSGIHSAPYGLPYFVPC